MRDTKKKAELPELISILMVFLWFLFMFLLMFSDILPIQFVKIPIILIIILLIILALAAVLYHILSFFINIIKNVAYKQREKILINHYAIIPYYKPPSNIHPAVAGFLIDKKIGGKEFYASLFDLIINGNIAIDEQIIQKKYKYFFIKNKGFSKSYSCNRIISEAVFKKDHKTIDAIPLKDIEILTEYLSLFVISKLKRFNYFKNDMKLSDHFLHWCEIKKIDIKSIISKYENRATLDRKELTNISNLLDDLIKKYNDDYNSFHFHIIKKYPNIFSSPRYTQKGAEERAKWLGFKDYLQTAERFRLDTEKVETFSKYLPYAVALGVETQWAKRFENMNIDRLEWFHSQVPREIKRHDKIYFKHLVKFLGQIYVK